MELVTGPSGTEVRGARPLLPSPVAGRSGSFAVDLERSFVVGSKRETVRSPLNAVLGFDGSATRYLDVAVWGLGLDWAATILGRRLPAEGTSMTGAAALGLIEGAAGARSEDLRALASAAEHLGGAVEPEPRAQHVVTLSRLMAPLRITAAHRMTLDDWAGRLAPVYRADDLLALAALELVLATEAGRFVSRCAHCDRLFLPANRTDEIYCSRPAPGEVVGGRTCRQLGPQRRYSASLDDLGAAYRRAYKRLDNRERRGHILRSHLDSWRLAARSLLAEAEAAAWDRSRFEQALAEIEPKESGRGAH